MIATADVRLTDDTLNNNSWARAYKTSSKKPKVHVVVHDVGGSCKSALCNSSIMLLSTVIKGSRLNSLSIGEFCKNCISVLEKEGVEQ